MEVECRFKAYYTTLGMLSSVVRALCEREIVLLVRLIVMVFDFVTVRFDIFEGLLIS